jgi:hypothetical protein
MRQRLTQQFVDELHADGRDRIVFDALVAGFGIRVTAPGTKIFVVHVRVGGRLRRAAIGRFPGISVAAARELARSALRDLRAGRDPRVEEEARAKATENGATTVAAFSDRWLAEHVRPKRKPRTISDYERLLEQKILPVLCRWRASPKRMCSSCMPQ